MYGDQRHPEPLGGHYHHGLVALAAKTRLQVLGVAGKLEVVAVDGVLVDGAGDQHVYQPLAQVGGGALEGREGGIAAGLGGLAGVDGGVFGHDIDDVVACLRGVGVCRRLDHGEPHLGEVLDILAIERGYLGRPVDHRGAYLGNAGILEGLEQHLIAYAVYVAVGDAHAEFSVFHFSEQGFTVGKPIRYGRS